MIGANIDIVHGECSGSVGVDCRTGEVSDFVADKDVAGGCSEFAVAAAEVVEVGARIGDVDVGAAVDDAVHDVG